MSPLGLPAVQLSIQQQELFDKPLKGFSGFSVAVGAFYQALASQVLSGETLITDGSFSLCPDVLLNDGRTVAEVKAASNKTAYRLRYEQILSYRGLAEGGQFRVLYAFFQHGLRTGYKALSSRSVGGAVADLSGATRFLVVLELPVLDMLCRHIPQTEDALFGTCLRLPHQALRQFIDQPVDTLKAMGISLSDFLVVQSEVSGLVVADMLVQTFPVTYVYRKDRRSVMPRPVDLRVLSSKFAPTVHEDDTDSEEDACPPF